jgi:hypothetical protein
MTRASTCIRRRTALLITFLLLPTSIFAEESSASSSADSGKPSSRIESWTGQRIAKEDRLTPERLNQVERFLIWVEEKGAAQGQLNIHFHRIYPGGSIARTGSGLSLGARYWHADLGQTPMDIGVSSAASLRGYHELGFQFGKVKDANLQFALDPSLQGKIFLDQGAGVPSQERFFLLVDLRSARFARENFFGLGDESNRHFRSDFALRQDSYDGLFGYRITPSLSMNLRAGLLQPALSRGNDRRYTDTLDLFDDHEAPGASRQPDFLRYQSSLVLDARDRSGNGQRGGLLGVSWSQFREVSGKEFRFNRLSADARYYLPLGSSRQVLAVRGFTTMDRTSNGARVPFYLMQTLGGGQTLRGFREMRFRGENLLYLSAEYRWEAAVFLEFAAFYDAGKAFRHLSDFDLTGLRKSPGFGARFKTPNAVVLRLDVSRSNEGALLQFRFGPSF